MGAFLGILAWGAHKASGRWQASYEATIQAQEDAQARSEELFRGIQDDIGSLSESKARLENENRDLSSGLIQFQRDQLEQRSVLEQITAERQQLRDDLRRADSRLETWQANYKALQETLGQIEADIKTQERSKARLSAEELRQAEKVARLEGQVDALVRVSTQKARRPSRPVRSHHYYPGGIRVVIIKRGGRDTNSDRQSDPPARNTNPFFAINQRLRDSSDRFFSINKRITPAFRTPGTQTVRIRN